MKFTHGLGRLPDPAIVVLQPGIAFSSSCLRIGDRRFRFIALADVHIRQAARDPLAVRMAGIALLGGVALGLLAPILRTDGVLVGLSLVMTLAGLAAVVSFRRPRRLELRANYAGQDVVLFVSNDHWAVHAIERHLRRVLVEVHWAQLAGPELIGNDRSRPASVARRDRKDRRDCVIEHGYHLVDDESHR